MNNIIVIPTAQHKTYNLGKWASVIEMAQAMHHEGRVEAGRELIRSWEELPEEAVVWLTAQESVPMHYHNKDEVSFIYPPVEGL